MPRRVLIATRDPGLDAALQAELEAGRLLLTRCSGAAAARDRVHQALGEPIEVVVGEANLETVDAWAALLAQDPTLQLLLVVDADPTADLVLRALRAGASDVLARPLAPGALAAALGQASVRRDARIARLRSLRDGLKLCNPGACRHVESSRANLAAEAARRQRSEDELIRWRVVRQLLPTLQGRASGAAPGFEELLGSSPT